MNNELLHERHFSFISSYRGVFDYGVVLQNANRHRLSTRTFRDTHDKYCTLGAVDFEREVNGCLGYVTCLSPSVLTDQMVAAFNRYRFLDHERQVNTMLANPKRYGDFTPSIFQLYIGARYDRDTKSWVPINDFESVRILAGIPADKCVNAREQSRAQLALVA